MPPLSVSDYRHMLSDPTPETMERYLRVGERETWRKLPMLATRLRIAHALQALQDDADRAAGMPARAAGRADRPAYESYERRCFF